MAAFLAKQMVGNQLSAVKADMGSDGPSAEERARMEEEEQERLAAIQEAEEIRKDKHRKMEMEREKVRQSVRDKYGIKKKEDKEDEKRRQQEAEMAAHLAAINPRNPANQNKLPPGVNTGGEEEDFATKLMNGNLAGATSHVMNKVQSFLPPGFPSFK
ncbi:putative complexin-1 [Fragariocoptes setiger]|uniref:Complexin-1 n=1 Tax=Fragariocoptes setiger TaxID=1670756 RepID=A0ABQ7S821_9ACAR|nr:putative complexin-1 [Fragariocoptes setiger]